MMLYMLSFFDRARAVRRDKIPGYRCVTELQEFEMKRVNVLAVSGSRPNEPLLPHPGLPYKVKNSQNGHTWRSFSYGNISRGLDTQELAQELSERRMKSF